MQKGKFIVLYGINNLGKTTQAKLLIERLNKNGYNAEYLKYPIYDLKPSGHILNNYLREGNIYGLSPREAQIIYTQNRTQYEKELINKLNSGINIIAEDYTGTGLAWGIGAGVDEYFLKHLNSKLLREDIAFIFDGERFREATEEGHKHETNNELTNKVRQAHLKLAYELDWVPINANKTIEEIHHDLWRYTKSIIENNLPDISINFLSPQYEEFNNPRHAPRKNFHSIIQSNIKKQLDLEKRKSSQDINFSNSNSFSVPTSTCHPASLAESSPRFGETGRRECMPRISESSSPHQLENSRNNNCLLKVEKIHPKAKLPRRAHSTDAGMDFYSDEYYTLFPGDITSIHTGIKIALPKNHVGLIWDKSGIAKQGIKTMGGVIDSDYRGEIIILLKNQGYDIFNIIPGQKVAQMLIQKIETPEIKETNVNNDTERGEGGFGSTGTY